MKRSLLWVLVFFFAVAGLSAEEQVTAIGDIRRGEMVTVTGEVTRVRDYDEFLMRDESGRARIYFRGGLDRSELESGDVVTVTGRVDDDLIDIPREIYATEIRLPDGEVLEARGGYDW